jgi:protein-L-isoaspartate(D-aspartate) O-methyltransferase
MFAPKLEARLLQQLSVRRHEHALEIGTGSGYLAALLAHRARRVVSCEIHEGLAAFGRENLRRAGVRNAVVEQCNGARPPGNDRFDVIVLAGSVPFVPKDLLMRLNQGGRLVAIVGEAPADDRAALDPHRRRRLHRRRPVPKPAPNRWRASRKRALRF